MSERDELADMVYRHHYANPASPGIQPLTQRPEWAIDIYYKAADAILAAGYRKQEL